MKFLALFMGFIFAVQMTWCPMADSATELSVTSGGGVQGQVPCNKVGALLFTDGLAIMSGNTIEIQAKSQDGKSQTQLNGTVFKVEKIGSGASGTITGSAYFSDGPGLATLDSASCNEKVELTDGTTVGGPISSITADTVNAAGRSIPIGQVLKIHSSRVFNFRLKAANAQHMSFEPTCLHAATTVKTKTTTTKTSSGEKCWVKRHPFITVTILAVVGCGIACAIAIPIACSQHHGHHSSAPVSSGSSVPSSSNPFSSSGC